MNVLSTILKILPGETIENLYNSRIGRGLVTLYDFVNRNQAVSVYMIHDLALMELDITKAGERALPFGAFEPNITRKFLENVKQGDIIFDVGSWIGYYALLAAPKANKVVAIEADPTNYDRIRKNIALNDFLNVQVLNVAAGEQESRGTIKKGPGSLMNKVISLENENSIPIRSLDNIISELEIKKIALMIMDIEGFEYYAIRGLSKSLSSGIVSKIICEIHPKMLQDNGISDEEVFNLLINFGYSIERIDSSPKLKPYHVIATVTKKRSADISQV